MEVITSRKNEKIVHLKKLAQSASYRRSSRETVCDGLKLLREAVSHGVRVRTVLYSGESAPEVPGAEVIRADRSLIDSVSNMSTAQDVFFSIELPELPGAAEVTGKVVILENIQDPGNVGTMIRTANAFGIDTVALLGNCADPFSPKTIRASMGAVFRQKIARIELSDIRALKAAGLRILGASLSERSTDLTQTDLKNAAVAIGNEGNGLSADFLDLCTGEVIIPMSPDCESLNAGAAAAVVMWEMIQRG